MTSRRIEKLFKIVTAGEGAVGKTTFLHRYTSDKFIENLKITIGVEFFSKILDINDKLYEIVIWDFGGQDQFRDLLSSYINGTAGALFLIDLTDIHRSIINLREWWEILHKEEDIPVMLIGAKYDLVEPESYEKQKITIGELREKYNFIDYRETSSKTGLNIGYCVEELVKKIV